MALSMRFWAPRTTVVRHSSGRGYSASANGTVDIPAPEAASVASDQAIALMLVGSTAERPVYVAGSVGGGLPRAMYDTTLGEPIFLVGSNPVSWVDITGAAV